MLPSLITCEPTGAGGGRRPILFHATDLGVAFDGGAACKQSGEAGAERLHVVRGAVSGLAAASAYCSWNMKRPFSVSEVWTE